MIKITYINLRRIDVHFTRLPATTELTILRVDISPAALNISVATGMYERFKEEKKKSEKVGFFKVKI